MYSSFGCLLLLVQVLRTVLFGVMPAYILLAVEGMIFLILTSPSGIKTNPRTRPMQIEAINFSSLFLANFFCIIMYGLMVAIGLSRKPWYAGPPDKASREF